MESPPAIGIAVSGIGACIGEPARARMLFCLMDGRARTGTELALVAAISPSTASVHLARLKTHKLVKVLVQGRHRYYSLANPDVAKALEALSVIAGDAPTFKPNTPHELRTARTCYDHMAGRIAVMLHDRMLTLGWFDPSGDDVDYAVRPVGAAALTELGIDAAQLNMQRRRFAFACVDWSERRPHLAGAVGAALLTLGLRSRWWVPELDSRRLRITRSGQYALLNRFGIQEVL